LLNSDAVSSVTLVSAGASSSAAAGSYAITASNATGTGLANYAITYATGTLTIGKATPAVALTLASGGSSAFVDNSITFTAAVSYASAPAATLAAPTGTVTFYDGSTALCSVSAAAASCTVNSASAPLSLGAHSITASYSGDANYHASASSAFSEMVVDFTATATSFAATVAPGQKAGITFTFSPSGPVTSFPAAITFSLSGLPAGYTYNFSPSTIAAGSGSTAVTLTIHAPLITAITRPASGSFLPCMAPFSLALLLLPFAGRMRKAGKRFGRMLSVMLLLGMSLVAAAGLSGCGSTSGFFGQAQKSYAVTVIATSGALSHATNVTLTVE
jgi:hypothetical protein